MSDLEIPNPPRGMSQLELVISTATTMLQARGAADPVDAAHAFLGDFPEVDEAERVRIVRAASFMAGFGDAVVAKAQRR